MALSAQSKLRMTAVASKALLIVLVLGLEGPAPSLGAQPASAIQGRNVAISEPSRAPDPAQLEAQYRERLARDPKDLDALKGVAAAETRLKNYQAASQAYKRVLEIAPGDREAQLGLAQVLGFSGHYAESISAYRGILEKRPDDAEALEGLGRVYLWSGRLSDSLSIFQRLAARYPSNSGYRLELARIAARQKDYWTARQILTSMLSTDSENHDARVELAYVDLYQGHYRNALQQFNQLLKADPTDFEALLGNARAAYYQGDVTYAHKLVTKLVEERPNEFDALILLVNLERARHNRRRARELLAQADRLIPNNPDVRALEKSIRDESRVALHVSASYAREIGSANVFGERTGLGNEDLRTFGYETTLGFSALPRTDSYISLYYLPSNSPSGGIRGAVGPSQFLYRQTTWLSPRLTFRGGAGLVRFGPGNLANIPSQAQPIPTAEFSPVGFANLSYALRKKVSIDLTAARSAITYTPTSVRLGIMENRLSSGLNFLLNRRTDLRLDYFFARYSSQPYEHVSIVHGTTQVVENKADHAQAHGGSATFNRNLFQSDCCSFDLGYSGLAYGYSGQQGNIFLGFFTPAFYQRHHLTTRLYGRLGGPVGYDFSGGIGVQQVEQGQALTRALLLNPALNLKVNSRLSLTLGYIHYNSAQSLGTLRGNAVRLSTDWKF